MSQRQLRKATEILDRIKKVEKNTWVLPSISNVEQLHTVVRTGLIDSDTVSVAGIEKNYECDCVGFQYSQNCYHIIAVVLFEKNKEVDELK